MKRAAPSGSRRRSASSAAVPRPSRPERRNASVELILDKSHYERVVLEALCQAKVSIWIATANLKDVHIEAPIGSVARARGRYVSLLERFDSLVQAGVEIRILHGALPSRPFRASLSKRRGLASRRFELRHCPRVHLKLIVVDGAFLYLGSANFTGAGLGAKSDGRRNFELGLVTDDDVLLDAAQLRFDRIYAGRECGACRLRSLCPGPLDELSPKRRAEKPASPASSVTAAPRARRPQSAK